MLNKIKKGGSAKQPKIMLIGVEGVGKSTAGAEMPNPIFICGENGLVGPQFANTDNFTPENWAEILQFCDELVKEKHEYKTVVIDTLDWIEPMLYRHVCEKAHKDNIEDFGFGKGYVVAQQEARQLLSRLEKLNNNGMAVMILSHCQIKTFNNPEGDNYDRYEPKVNLKIAGLFREWCDAVLFAQFDMYTEKDGSKTKAYGGQNRIVRTTHSAAWDAKNRYGLQDTMPLDIKEIMKAIEQGQPKDLSEMEKEAASLVKKLDGEAKKKSEEWLAKKSYTAQQLAKFINKLRVESSNKNEKEA